MKGNKKIVLAASGAFVTAALAGLLAGTASADQGAVGGISTTSRAPQSAIAGTFVGVIANEAGTHACAGKNECKGQGGCKSGDNGCKGKNSCKGKGGCATDGSGH